MNNRIGCASLVVVAMTAWALGELFLSTPTEQPVGSLPPGVHREGNYLVRTVTAEEFGERWPFTMRSGEILCNHQNGYSRSDWGIFFRPVNRKTMYVFNGYGQVVNRRAKFLEEDAVWLENTKLIEELKQYGQLSPKFKPKMELTYVENAAYALCEIDQGRRMP